MVGGDLWQVILVLLGIGAVVGLVVAVVSAVDRAGRTAAERPRLRTTR